MGRCCTWKKTLAPAKFLGNLELSGSHDVVLKMRKNAIFEKSAVFKWLYLYIYWIQLSLATGIWKVIKKAFKCWLLNVFIFKIRFLAYFQRRPAFEEFPSISLHLSHLKFNSAEYFCKGYVILNTEQFFSAL